MIQRVKLARDRRKRKSRIKALIFLIAIISILTGTLLSVDKNANSDQAKQTDTEFEAIHSNQKVQPVSVEIEKDAIAQNKKEESAGQKSESFLTSEKTAEDKNNAENQENTNFDESNDELTGQDDEVDEIKSDGDELAEELPEDAKDALNNLLDAANQAIKIKDQFTHTVTRGDKLKDVLELSGLEQEISDKLIASYPELKNLKPGQQIYWILDDQNNLEYLNWLVSEKEERVYERKDEQHFARQIIEKKSIWKKDVLKGEITGSFRASLAKLGLDSRQISQLSTALQWQFSMNKLGKGDKFALLVSREYLGDKLTGQGNVEGIHIISQGKSYYAIQAENGRYYNRQGETLGKGFARYPLQYQARISSPFNPNRRHPVTGRVRPHKGVDFSVSMNTAVIAPADGIVEKVAFQKGGAGRYIVIRHSREYQTVYMHLNKPLVRAGQSIKRGERIALSGNTGISTGPHLHYEFHINGRAVNPITVKLPGTNSSMAESERRSFLVRAKALEAKLRM